MRIYLTIILLLVSLTLSLGQTMSFQLHQIGEFRDRMGQTSLIDLDKDGDLDWIFGRFGEMYWYEYRAPSEWNLHEIGKGASTDVGGCPLDVNQDGWMDFVVGDSWYENPGNPGQASFILHRKNLISCHDNVAADLDGDGRKDIISLSNHPDHPVLAWYKMPEDYRHNWNYKKIGSGIHGGIAPRGYGDLDLDQDIDIVRGNVWYENKDGKGMEWVEHPILTPPRGNRPDKFGLALRSWCIDLDQDGDLDIIEAEADTPSGRVFWWENQEKGQKFLFHSISADSTGQDFHSLAVADFDNDGDADVLSGGGPLSSATRHLFIWENTHGKGSVWQEHVILSDYRIHEAVADDVDQDGDIDICTKPWHGGKHIYLENKLIK
ncbi:MAG: FG-GAP repeat domain-containing protein [Candidatus Cyclobacteriaceae bacterium M3_2C_046]